MVFSLVSPVLYLPVMNLFMQWVKNLSSCPSAARQAQVGGKLAHSGHTAPALPARGDRHLKSFQLERLHTSVTTKGSK